MVFFGINNESYVAAGELGRGGEGTVFDLQNRVGLVLKKYKAPLSEEKTKKLLAMVAMRSEEIETYAAWPVDLVRDEKGRAWGFVMKKLTGYAPLHKLFNPMDRKNLFPDKGYNFLVHVARNLATAFYKLHEAGLIVGDVNEGNILVNHNGLIAFIDCDSFQVRDEKGYFFCEVGVPRYTPPELLKKGSFEKVVRTVNTDSFSLAVLIFQLLFLGRHPFAGKNKSTVDYDEETAIRQKQFAYSLENKKKKLAPPPDSFDISNLPEQVTTLFHQAFEQDSRPEPLKWITALDELLKSMATCYESRVHTYPSNLAECPWCQFKRTRGISFFADNNFANNTLQPEIESFVNGFDAKSYELKKWSGNAIPPGLQPTPIDRQFRKYKLRGYMAAAIISILWAVFCMLTPYKYLAMPACFLPLIIYHYSPWAEKIRSELNRRVAALQSLKLKVNQLINDYNNPAEITTYDNKVGQLTKLVNDYRNLPGEFERRKREVEEKIYTEQQHNYLSHFEIKDYDIATFGPAKKLLLYNNGVYNAADISKLHTLKIPGIGHKNKQILCDWQAQLSANFLYVPDTVKIMARTEQVRKDVAILQQQVEAAIRREYQSLGHLKQHLAARSAYLDKQISEVSLKIAQAEIDVVAFRKFMK